MGLRAQLYSVCDMGSIKVVIGACDSYISTIFDLKSLSLVKRITKVPNAMNSATQVTMLYHIETTFDRFLFCLWISDIPLSLWFFLQTKIRV